MHRVITRTGIELNVGDVRRVPTGAPLRWLARGWHDLRRTPLDSIGYGALFVVLAYGITALAWQAPWIVVTLVTGFLLIAPAFAVVFYALSRELEQGRHASLATALGLWRDKALCTALYAGVLGLVLAFWIMASLVLTALSVYGAQVSIVSTLPALFTTPAGWTFVALYTASGAVFALVVYLGAAVSLPMMLDRGTDPVTAIATSAAAVLHNPRAMALWAALIVAITALGIVTAYIGLAVALPLISHATWHAYRDLVAE